MRPLIAPPGSAAATMTDATLDDASLASWYAYPSDTSAQRPWLRANFVSTLDGATSGADGRTGSINTSADRAVFALLRALADVIVVGAGTARTEGYAAAVTDQRWRAHRVAGITTRPTAPVIAVVSRSAELPATMRTPAAQPADGGGVGDGRGQVVLLTCATAPADRVAAARSALGDDGVIVAGRDSVDLGGAISLLANRFGGRLLCEGGSQLLRQLVGAELVDEFCLTTVPRLVGGSSPRLLSGGALDVELMPIAVLEADGALLTRWVPVGRLRRAGSPG